MTKQQFEQIVTNFANYAHVEVEYKKTNPSTMKQETRKGRLQGINIGALFGELIIANLGKSSIHYSRIKFPNNKL